MLTPRLRGAPDDVRAPLEGFLRAEVSLDVASQQVADRGIVDALADIRSVRGARARVFVEADYLTEAVPVDPGQVWQPVGDRDEHRQCFAALGRAGIQVRADLVAGALQHVNLVVAHGPDGPESVLMTSANFAPGSLDRHLNWAVRIDQPMVATAAAELFTAVWDGDFRGAVLATPVSDQAGGAIGRAVAGADGQATDEALNVIEEAQERIRFAWFAMSSGARVVESLLAAAARGVDVAGVIDGDQGLQTWNAVPHLRAGGVDARYYPGGLTGATGRMHHKTMAADRTVAHLSTANASHAAETAFELALTLDAAAVARALDDEVVRLGQNASTSVLEPL